MIANNNPRQKPLSADDLHQDLDHLWARLETGAYDNFQPGQQKLPALGAPIFQLDAQQKKAADHLYGPIRVLAPAGSGKTRTLTARIAALISQGISPEKILALAFNTKAAEEMRYRLEARGIHGIKARTFHSLGYEIIREVHGWTYKPENEAAVRNLAARQINKEVSLPVHSGFSKRVIQRGVDKLGEGKSSLLKFSEMQLFDGEQQQALDLAFKKWIQKQTDRGLLSFSDMIYFALRTLLQNNSIRNQQQSQHEFILVDEFQDLNTAQMLFLRLLSLPQNNLFVVGDDDQLIYAWRGAQPGYILEFNSMYPEAETVVLGTNYRSGHRIVRHSRWLIENNDQRVPKDISPVSTAERGWLGIALEETLEKQAEQAIRWVIHHKQTSTANWRDFGILFRSNDEAKFLTAQLDLHLVPYAQPNPQESNKAEPHLEFSKDQVNLMTIHKAKGKEFPYVVYFNLSERGSAVINQEDERRVTYVGFTRAEHHLLITADKASPSPFLREAALNPSLSDFAAPYLQRAFIHAVRRHMLKERQYAQWIKSLFRWPGPDKISTQIKRLPEVEALLTELHFRSLLGVNIQP